MLALRATLREGAALGEAAAPGTEPKATPPAEPTAEMPIADRGAMLAELKTLQAELAALQGETPLILPSVDEQAVAAVVGDWTGIPVGRMVKNEVQAVLDLSKTLAQRVIGQDHALEMIAKRVQTARAGLDNPSKPIGVFMLCGPSGVGKTETALALAESLYGGEQNLITINMSEFQEAHTVSTLKGAPPGYVGYGEGGVLTEAVRRKPYSRRAAGRGREGALRRARDLLPGVRQGPDGGWRRAADRLQEHADHPDLECRHRPDHVDVRATRS